eukprot:16099_1
MSSSVDAVAVTQEEATNGLYLLFGLSLGFAAEFWIGMGSIQIKYSHKLDAISSHPRPPYCRGRWWFGFCLLTVNVAFNFASYMFASLNILAPTSALVIVINVILARIYFGEQLTFSGYFGSLFIMIGCVLSIIFGTHAQDELKLSNLFIKADTPSFVLFTSIHGALCIVLGLIGATKWAQMHVLQNMPLPPLNHSIQYNEEIECVNTDDIPLLDEDNAHSTDNEEEDAKREQSPPSNANIDSEIEYDETPLIHKTSQTLEAIQREEYKHILRCVFIAFATAGLVSWVQFLGKIGADLFFETFFHYNNQFTSAKPLMIVVVLAFLLPMELYMMSEMMRIFDAVLVIPIYNSLQILSTIALSAVYWQNFKDWNAKDSVFFSLGLLLIFCGIAAISHGQKHQSMANHVDDKRLYVAGAKAQNKNLPRYIPSMSEREIDL